MCLLLSWDFAFKTESAEVRKGGERIMEHFKRNGRMRDKGRGRETQPKKTSAYEYQTVYVHVLVQYSQTLQS